MPRQPSPRQEQQMRPYGEPNRPGPLGPGPVPGPAQGPAPGPGPAQGPGPAPNSAPIRRGPSPGPHYGPSPSQSQPPPAHAPSRVANPNYTGPTMPGSMPSQNGGPQSYSLMNHRPQGSPRPESRPPPMLDNRMPSPKSAYPQHPPPYPHHPEAGPSSMDNSVSTPKGPMGPEGPMHRDDRPSSVGPKRMREMEDQRRADDQRRTEDMRRAEEQQRHGNEQYHPSDAAHHPPAHSMPPNHLPPMQQGPSPMQGIIHEPPPPSAAPKEYPQDERSRVEHNPTPAPPPLNEPERAARKMDVDEDYDDSGEEEKKVPIGGPTSGPPSAAGDMKTTTPTSATMNGMGAGPTPKTEGTS
ncbi:putative TPR-containing protein Mql1 [Apiospora arundinis]